MKNYRSFHPPSDWLRPFSSQTLSCINTPTFSIPVILHTYPPMKTEQSVPKRRHIKLPRRKHTIIIVYFISAFVGRYTDCFVCCDSTVGKHNK
jgi:hypothetical protein